MIVCARNVSAAAASAQTLLHLFEIFATSCTFPCICCLVSSKLINVFCVDIDVCCCHCRWFRSLRSPSPFWTQRGFTVLFDEFTWVAMVKHWKPCILIQVKNPKSQKSLAKTHAPMTSVRMRRSQSGVTFSDSDVYLVPSPIVQICRNNSDWSEDDPSWILKVLHFVSLLYFFICLFLFSCTLGQGDLSLHVLLMVNGDKFVSLARVKAAMQQAGQGNRIQISQISVIINMRII